VQGVRPEDRLYAAGAGAECHKAQLDSKKTLFARDFPDWSSQAKTPPLNARNDSRLHAQIENFFRFPG
jgi:hypothetical protein